VIRRLAGIRPSFDFSSHATLYLHGRLSPDELLSRTQVREIGIEGEAESLLVWLASVRKEGVNALRPLPLAAGDWQGLSPADPDQVAGLEAVVVSESGHLLILDGRRATLLRHQGCAPAGVISNLMSALIHEIKQVTNLAEQGGGVLPLAQPDESILELPSGYKPFAQRLTKTASTMLVLDELLASSSIDLSSKGHQLRMGIRECARLARSSLAAVITPQSIEVV
jgi:hypothetical protein